MKKLNIGLIGFGTIGTGVVKILKEKTSLISQRCGCELTISMVADKDVTTPRKVKVKKEILTTNVKKIIDDPKINVVVELIGGLHPAKEIIISCLKKGKHVVTANKALLAAHGAQIFEVAQKEGVNVLFEASVGGGIPIIKALREGLVVNKIKAIFGIINGTSNYILTKMTKSDCSFNEALKEAKGGGFAEEDPSLDVEGIDSAHKLVILASLAFRTRVELGDIYTEGITKISSDDLRYAGEMGYAVKLLAIAKEVGGALEVRVHPTLISKEYLMSQVAWAYNAIYLKGDLIEENIFYGKGAGMMAAAGAVVADLVDLALELGDRKQPKVLAIPSEKKIPIRKMGDVETRYYIRLQAIDQPGVLANIAGILGANHISIASVIQKERMEEKVVPIVMMTHEAKESSLCKAMAEIDKLKAIKGKSVIIRIESKE